MRTSCVFCALLVGLFVSFLPAQTIHVPTDQPTIQAAVDAVASGGTILVDPGVYQEVILIDPAGVLGTVHGPAGGFTIQGSGPGVIIRLPSSPRPATGLTTTTGTPADPSLGIENATGIVLDGLEFDGNDDIVGGNKTVAVFIQDSTVTITNSNFHNYRQSATSGAQNGAAFWITTAASTSTVTVQSCSFIRNQKGDIVTRGDSVCNVLNSTFTGRGPDLHIAQNAIQYSFGGRGTVDGCTITGYWFTPGSFTSTGILGFDGGSPIVIQNTTLKDCQTGIFWQSNTVLTIDFTVSNCDLTDVAQSAQGFDGIDVFDNIASGGPLTGTWTIQNNTFNNLNGSGFWSNNSPGGTVTGNTFNNNGAAFSFNNAEDASAGGNTWDSNSWSDFASNPGYPTTYQVPGVGGAVDNNPNGNCADFSVAEFSVGVNPTDVAMGDLDGDGFADLISANGGSDDLSLLINDGAGGFGPASAVALTAGDMPSSVAMGDLVSGGPPDLAVACKGSDVVRVVDGTSLTVSASIATPASQPTDVCVAQLDGTGTMDIVVGMAGSPFAGIGGVAVIENGGPALLLPAPVGGFLTINKVACCDLDGDGDLDIAATMSGTVLSPTTTDNVLLYQNDGTGVFTLEGALSPGQNPKGISCFDLDDDGDEDLAVAVDAFPTAAFGGLITFISGGLTPGAWNIPADFTASPSTEGAILPNDVVCADLGDNSISGFFSRPDVITTNFGSGNITVFKGFDGTSFGAILSCAAGVNPVALAVGELNGDNTPDLVAASHSNNSLVVELAQPRALAQKFGAGCAGTSGLVPDISAVGLPTFNNPAFGVKLTNARANSPALLGVSLGLLPQDLGTGCTLYLAPAILSFQLFTNSFGEAELDFPIPPSVDPFRGLNAYFQWVIFDPAGTHLGLLSFSDALRIKMGS